MKYRIFDTEQEALQAEENIRSELDIVRVGINAKTGEPAFDKQATVRWAVPKQTAGGQWAFISPDEEGVEFSPEWWPELQAHQESDVTNAVTAAGASDTVTFG